MSRRRMLSDAGVEPGHTTRAARRRVPIRSLARGWALGCLLALGCEAKRNQSEPVASVELQQARPAAAAAKLPRAAMPAPVRTRQTARAETSARAHMALASEQELEEIAPGANEEFDPAALADVQQALSATNESAFALLVRRQTNADGEREEKRVTPSNCRSWRALKNRGFAPRNALGEQIDSGALVRCGALEFLARAKPSRVSYVRGALNGAGPRALPAVVASATSKLAREARGAAVSKRMTLAEFLPDARGGESELPGRVLILEPLSATSVMLNAEAWGDVNSDQVEDLLVSVLNSSDDASYYEMRLLELTRTSPRGPLRVLAVSQ